MFPLKITAMGIHPSSCQGREQLNSASVDSSAGSSKPPTQTRAKPGVRWGLNQAFLPWPDCHQAAGTLSVSPTLPLSLIFAPQTPLPSPSKAEVHPLPSLEPRLFPFSCVWPLSAQPQPEMGRDYPSASPWMVCGVHPHGGAIHMEGPGSATNLFTRQP